FMIVFKISKLTTHQILMFLIGVVITITWIPRIENKNLIWIFFTADTIVILIIAALNYLLNIVFVGKSLILKLRKIFKKKSG
ncbi:hypothetical protein, partial [Mycoplasmopsis cricetuli]